VALVLGGLIGLRARVPGAMKRAFRTSRSCGAGAALLARSASCLATLGWTGGCTRHWIPGRGLIFQRGTMSGRDDRDHCLDPPDRLLASAAEALFGVHSHGGDRCVLLELYRVSDWSTRRVARHAHRYRNRATDEPPKSDGFPGRFITMQAQEIGDERRPAQFP